MHFELKWFIFLFVGLWLAWLVTGGPDRKAFNRTHPFLEEPSPVDSGKVYTLDELKDRNRP